MSKKPVSPLRQRLIDNITARRFSEDTLSRCPYPRALAARLPPLPRERFSRVPGMFSSLEVKVLYPT